MRNKSRHINKFIYCFSLLTWIINICLIIIPFFFEVSGIWVVGIFASILIQGITSKAFGDNSAIPEVKIKPKFLDICLKDEKGADRSLADLRGKVVILDFSAIEMEQSMGYVFELRELYNRYSKSGLEIYSVSLDRNKLLWEDGVANLPWVNVYAGDKAAEVLTRYNVQSLPTLFLLDRKGNVQGRYIGFEQLGTDLRKYF